jgi:DNA-binding MarR family transcriptional regulator
VNGSDSDDDFLALARRALVAADPTQDVSVLDFGLSLIRAGNRLQHDLDEVVNRPAGVSAAAFRVMFTIQSVGAVTPKRLALLSNTSAASISSLLRTLERAQLIVREPDDTDGRSVRISLSPAGHEATGALLVRNHERMAQWAASIPSEARTALVALLGQFLRVPVPDKPPRADVLAARAADAGTMSSA